MISQELINTGKEIIKNNRKQGKVLDVSEAFKLYPIEEEWHKGKLDFWLDEIKRREEIAI